MSETKALVVSPRTFAEVQTFAEVLSKSDLLPVALRGKIPDLVFSILAGLELGLEPIASIRGIHIIAGKPILAADTMMGLVLGSGLAEYFVQTESTATSVTFECKRKGAPVPQKCTWTMDDAKRAGLNTKDVWRQYPRQMLAARCKAELARGAFPDLLAGCYDPDEIPNGPSSFVPTVVASNPEPDAVDAEIVEDLAKLCTDAPTVEALKALVPRLAELPKDSRARDDARKAYAERMTRFEAEAKPVEAVA